MQFNHTASFGQTHNDLVSSACDAPAIAGLAARHGKPCGNDQNERRDNAHASKWCTHAPSVLSRVESMPFPLRSTP